MNDTTYVGMRYVPVFADPPQWDISRQFENLTMVTVDGETYISKKLVPTGVAITNEEYWVKISVPSGGSSGGGINYSTEEQDTGLLWIDGKHIYQKTYYNTYSYLANGDSLNFGSDVINKYVTNSVVMVDDGNGANTTSLYGVKCVPDGRAYFQSSGTLSGNINMYVTLWYTKNSD